MNNSDVVKLVLENLKKNIIMQKIANNKIEEDLKNMSEVDTLMEELARLKREGIDLQIKHKGRLIEWRQYDWSKFTQSSH